MIHGNITNKPLTRWAALRGPRRAGRADFADRADFEGRADLAGRAVVDFIVGQIETVLTAIQSH